MGTGYPGYTGVIPQSTALVSEVLRGNGYATSMFGKWHNTPEPDISPAGPFDRWPTGLGFEYFYGFNQGEAHQFYPTLYRDTNPVAPPKPPEEGYHLTEDLTDEAISRVNNVRAANPDKPWFAYFSTGAVHAPHHVLTDWQGRYAGRFDHGWDREREIVHGRQLEMGVIPQGTEPHGNPTGTQHDSLRAESGRQAGSNGPRLLQAPSINGSSIPRADRCCVPDSRRQSCSGGRNTTEGTEDTEEDAIEPVLESEAVNNRFKTCEQSTPRPS